jgi:hypothetical protein
MGSRSRHCGGAHRSISEGYGARWRRKEGEAHGQECERDAMRHTRQEHLAVDAAAALSEAVVHLLSSRGGGLPAWPRRGRGATQLRYSRGKTGPQAVEPRNHVARESESETKSGAGLSGIPHTSRCTHSGPWRQAYAAPGSSEASQVCAPMPFPVPLPTGCAAWLSLVPPPLALRAGAHHEWHRYTGPPPGRSLRCGLHGAPNSCDDALPSCSQAAPRGGGPATVMNAVLENVVCRFPARLVMRAAAAGSPLLSARSDGLPSLSM